MDSLEQGRGIVWHIRTRTHRQDSCFLPSIAHLLTFDFICLSLERDPELGTLD